MEQRGWPFATEVAPTGLARYLGGLECSSLLPGWLGTEGVLVWFFFPREYFCLLGFFCQLGWVLPPSLVGAVLTAKWEVAGGERVVLEQRGWPFATEVAPTGLAGYRGWLESSSLLLGWLGTEVGWGWFY